MCGIVGFLHSGEGQHSWAAALPAMSRLHDRRGPDGDGSWSDPEAGVGLAHRRLAVVDLGPTGTQPMVSRSGRFVVVLNGEIYDYREHRRELEQIGVAFRGTSDTEVLLAMIDRWGLRESLERCNGMFALALWDRSERRLTLARDRLGEKPLYYASAPNGFAFASRLSALRLAPGFRAALDEVSVGHLLRMGFIPHPRTIYAGAAQVAPGELVEVTAAAGRLDVRRENWWSLDRVFVADNQRHAADCDELEQLLIDAVRMRLRADVPTGAFLSGGIDSSLVAAIGRTIGPLRTFTVAVGDPALDESRRAARIAQHLGTDHTTIDLSSVDVVASVDETLSALDEPLADPSTVPTLLLCREVRRHVTVALGGDGGDELFAGYNRHVVGARAWDRAARLPAPLGRGVARALRAIPPQVAEQAGAISSRVRGRDAVPHPHDKLTKLAAMLAADRGAGAWSSLAPVWQSVPWTRGAVDEDPVAPPFCRSTLDRLRWLDTAVTLPDNMLTKVDRASMHWGLEVRLPLLDPRLASMAWRIRNDELVSRGTGKAPLRRLLDRHLPRSLTEGQKRGFDPPMADWLRGPLRAWAEERLEPARLAASGWLDPAPVRRAWREHLEQRSNHDYRLWTILTFVDFLERHA